MTRATDAYFAGSIPALYERYLVPLLFQPYADDLAARLADLQRGSILEVAAGTGAVTRTLASQLPERVEIVATDLNEGMLRWCEERLPRRGISLRQADAQQLPFEAERFDVVVSQFGVMFLPDKPLGFREAWRVLRRGGRYLFNVWNRIEDNEVTAVAEQALAEAFPADPPRFMTRTPFGYFDEAVIRADLRSAGFRRIDIDVVAKATQGTVEQAALGLCQGTPLRSEIELRDATRLDEVTEVVRSALEARFGPHALDNRMSALVVSAWRD
jgi:ubiquinone/menaquinone biosynthesis C-methylase UbiE